MVFTQPPVPQVLFRCDGSSSLGLGHVVRCLALADVFREVYGWQVSFCMRQGPIGIQEVRNRGYSVRVPDQANHIQKPSWFSGAMSGVPGEVLICDVRDDLQKEVLHKLRRKGILVVLLDDLTERRLAADMVFYPPIPQLDGLEWKGFTGRIYVGWEWVVLRRDVRNAKKTTASEFPRIVITMGGSDPFGFTLKAVLAIEHVQHEVDVIVVLGPGFSQNRELTQQMAGLRRAMDVRANVSNLPQLLAQADLVVGAFGTTAYELAVIGVPGIFLCASADHAESARAFMNAGFGVSLGLGADVNEMALAETIDREIAGLQRGSTLKPALNPGQMIDGYGAERVAEQIVMAVQERRGSHEAMAVS